MFNRNLCTPFGCFVAGVCMGAGGLFIGYKLTGASHGSTCPNIYIVDRSRCRCKQEKNTTKSVVPTNTPADPTFEPLEPLEIQNQVVPEFQEVQTLSKEPLQSSIS